MIPAWAFARNPWWIAPAAILHASFCSAGRVGGGARAPQRAFAGFRAGHLPRIGLQLGNLLAACTPNIQSWLARHHGGDFGFALAWSVAGGAVVLAAAAFLGPEARMAVLTMTPGAAPPVEPVLE